MQGGLRPGWRDEGRAGTAEAGAAPRGDGGVAEVSHVPSLHFIRGTLAAAGRTGRCRPGAHLGSAVGEVDAEMLSVISAPRCARTSVSLRQMMWDGEVGLLRTPKKSLPGWRMEESQQDHPPNGSQQ